MRLLHQIVLLRRLSDMTPWKQFGVVRHGLLFLVLMKAPADDFPRALAHQLKRVLASSERSVDLLGRCLLRFLINHGLRKFAQSPVCILFFVERLLEKLGAFVVAKFIRPCSQCAITSNLIVLHRLG